MHFRGFFFIFLARRGGLTLHAETYNIHSLPNLAGQNLPLLNLTGPKISIFIIFNNSYKQHFTRKCTRSNKSPSGTMNQHEFTLSKGGSGLIASFVVIT